MPKGNMMGTAVAEPRSAVGGKPRHEQTTAIIRLRPGRKLDLTPEDGDCHGERIRVLSRIRTARIETGKKYTTAIEGGRLIVRCRKV